MTLQDRATTLANHERFIRRVVASGEVWALESPDGWAACESVEDVDEGDEEAPREVMPFWSDRAYAQRAAAGEWEHFVPTAIPLDLFIDRWLKDMHDDGTLVGTNWDAHGCGVEIEAIELAQALVDALDEGTKEP
jgi:hypothetical protein